MVGGAWREFCRSGEFNDRQRYGVNDSASGLSKDPDVVCGSISGVEIGSEIAIYIVERHGVVGLDNQGDNLGTGRSRVDCDGMGAVAWRRQKGMRRDNMVQWRVQTPRPSDVKEKNGNWNKIY